jgi:hypothetical protein
VWSKVVLPCCQVISTLVTCTLLRTKRLDDLLMQEGFAFSHCTTYKAQFYLRPELHEDHSWRKIKFKLSMAQDVFLIFLVVQTVCWSHFYLFFCFLIGMARDTDTHSKCNSDSHIGSTRHSRLFHLGFYALCQSPCGYFLQEFFVIYP